MALSTTKFNELSVNLTKSFENRKIQNGRDVAKYAIAHEGAHEMVGTYQASMDSLDDMVLEAITMTGISHESYTDAQLALAKMSAKIAIGQANGLDVGSMIARSVSETSKSKLSMADAGVDQSIAYEDMKDVFISHESYDGQKQNNPFILSVLYNFAFASQDEFVEAFFPTVPVDPTTSDIFVEVTFASLMKEFYRDINGGSARGKFNKIPLIKAIYDATIFDTDKTLLVPVLRDNNEDKFLKDEKWVSNESLEEVTTAPLKFGTNIDLLGISQTDLELSKGKADNTDALDRGLTLSKIYFSIDNDMFAYDLRETSGSAFVYWPAGHEKDLALKFTNNTLVIHTSDTKTSKGTESTVLSSLPAGYTVGFQVNIYGEANTQSGDVKLDATPGVEIKYILNAAGQKLAETDNDYSTIVEKIQTLKLEGYVLYGHSTNSNLRKRGQLLTVDMMRRPFPVFWRSGFTIMGPVKSETGTDNDINNQALGGAQALGAKMSVMGVSKLLRDVENLKYLTNDGTKPVNRTEFETGFIGMGQYLLEPTYFEQNIDLATNVDSLNSSSRDDDIRNNLLQTIFNVGMELYLRSDFGVVFDKGLITTDAAKPTLIVGTDPNIKRLLVKDKDIIALGNTFDIRVVSTFDKRLAGKIVLSFGIFDGQRNSTPNVLNYGFTATSAAIVYDLVRDTNNTTNREITTMPRFTHYTNIPVVGLITVSGIHAVYGKLPVYAKNVD